MTATTIFFNGRVISVPGSYSEVDASGLEPVGLGASGIVAILGDAVGGIPVAAITDPKQFLRFTSPDKLRKAFVSGDLLEAGCFAFEPAKDQDIVAGAQQVVAMKTNPATRSGASFSTAGIDCIDLLSADWGAFTEQINVELQAGSTKGKLLTIRFENTVETVDNLAGDVLGSLQYSGGPLGYTTATATVSRAGDVTVTGTRVGAGQASSILAASPGGAITVASDNAADIGQVVTIFGLIAGVPTMASATLNGTTPATFPNSWDAGSVLGVNITGAATVGNVSVKGGSTTVMTVAPGNTTIGVLICQYHYVDKSSVQLALSAAGAQNAYVFGRTAAGSPVTENVTCNGTTPVTTTTSTFAFVDFLVVGAIPNATSITLTARAARSLGAVQTTIKKVADYFNARQAIIAGPTSRGFIFTLSTSRLLLPPTSLDVQPSTNILGPAALSLTADVFLIVEWINQNSQLITASISQTATTTPDNTPGPLFLSGGSEGTSSFGDYQNALNLLKRTRVNTVVVVTGDPAVHAALDAHCAYMGGIGRSERDGCVGLMNSGLTDVPNKTELEAQIINLNSRHLRAVAQAVERFDSTGTQREFSPPFAAAIIAGMQAGTSVGTPLTHKYANILGFRQHPTWNPTDDAEELIQSGLLFFEQVDGVGRRVVRNITTHLSTDNIAFVEASVNQSVDYAVFTFRSGLEAAVGRKGVLGTIPSVRGLAVGLLAALVSDEAIAGWRSLNLDLIADVMDVATEMAPVIPINFVKTSVHLVTLAQLAATQAAA